MTDMLHCSILQGVGQRINCRSCAGPLPKGKITWCSKECEDIAWQNHDWHTARQAAHRRTQIRCENCQGPGQEVHHIEKAADYSWGCQHHQEGLVVLCCDCHEVVHHPGLLEPLPEKKLGPEDRVRQGQMGLW